MASLRNAVKTQKVHRERHQPMERNHLGPMEKKKDYKIRAKDQEEKKEALKTLRKRALDKNPDEFQYHMINSEIRDSVHIEKVKGEELQIRDVAQDLTYIRHRRSKEKKKIEKLEAQLHLLGVNSAEGEQQQNSHILFVDSEKEAKMTDPATRLDTHPELLNRAYNRPKLSQLASSFKVPRPSAEVTQAQRKAYKELAQRLERMEKLRLLEEKLTVRKQLMKNKAAGGKKPKLVKEGSSTSVPEYRWPAVRKK